MISPVVRSVTALVVMLVLAAPAAAAGKAGGSIKCWTNKDGVRECGNTIPPEYSQQQTETLNKEGMTVQVKERAKTPEEVEKERAVKEAEAAQKAADAKAAADRAAYDQMLLATFTTEQDLIDARKRKLSAIDATIEITNATITSLNRKLAGMKQKAAQLERGGSAAPDELKEDMASLEKQIANKQQYIETQNQEKTAVAAQYDADLARYRELKQNYPH